MRVDFTKMQSLGNDFVVLDGVRQKISMTPDLSRHLADRHFGIGCDQILLAEPSERADFRFRIFNQDGSEVEQCGNGARCFARFVRDQSLTSKDEITVLTINRSMKIRLLEGGGVSVDMGAPEFEPAKIPITAALPQPTYKLLLEHGDQPAKEITISALSMGNPHAVMLVDDIDTAPVLQDGALIESHRYFPQRVNAGFMQIVSRDRIRLRVFERGVGETLGCGSGACAAVVSGIELGLLDESVIVSLPGGDAAVSWLKGKSPVLLSGSAHYVFNGVIDV